MEFRAGKIVRLQFWKLLLFIYSWDSDCDICDCPYSVRNNQRSFWQKALRLRVILRGTVKVPTCHQQKWKKDLWTTVKNVLSTVCDQERSGIWRNTKVKTTTRAISRLLGIYLSVKRVDLNQQSDFKLQRSMVTYPNSQIITPNFWNDWRWKRVKIDNWFWGKWEIDFGKKVAS